MKKKFFALMLVALLSVGLVTGCGSDSSKSEKKDSSSKKSYEELLKLYEKAYNDGDVELLLQVFPSFMEDEIKTYYTVESLEYAKEEYGSDAKVEIKVKDTTKMSDQWIEQANEDLAQMYGDGIKVKECEQLNGTISITGSKSSDEFDIEEMWYCDFGNEWRIIGG